MSTESGNGCLRYFLRPLSFEHISIIAKWHERIDDLKLFDRRMPLPVGVEAMEGEWRTSIDATEPRTSYWFVIINPDDEVVGIAGLQDINYVHGDSVMAILVAESGRRKGIGIRCGALLLDVAFHQLRLHRVSSFVRADNEGSNQMTARLGFQEEGRIRKGWYTDGKYVDIRSIGILGDEWDAQSPKLMYELGHDMQMTIGENDSEKWCWPR